MRPLYSILFLTSVSFLKALSLYCGIKATNKKAIKPTTPPINIMIKMLKSSSPDGSAPAFISFAWEIKLAYENSG